MLLTGIHYVIKPEVVTDTRFKGRALVYLYIVYIGDRVPCTTHVQSDVKNHELARVSFVIYHLALHSHTPYRPHRIAFYQSKEIEGSSISDQRLFIAAYSQ